MMPGKRDKVTQNVTDTLKAHDATLRNISHCLVLSNTNTYTHATTKRCKYMRWRGTTNTHATGAFQFTHKCTHTHTHTHTHEKWGNVCGPWSYCHWQRLW